MGNCCSNDDDRPDQHFHQNACVNYGPLKRDEEDLQINQPNTVTFGQPVKVDDFPQDDFQNGEFIHDGQQFLAESRISQNREPLEKSFRAVITSPEKNADRTNRIRVINQVQQENFVSEPLADTQKDTRCMELNKNLKTPQLSNSIYRGQFTVVSNEKPFYNAATNQNQNTSSFYQVNTGSSVIHTFQGHNVNPNTSNINTNANNNIYYTNGSVTHTEYPNYQQSQVQTKVPQYAQSQAAPSNLSHGNNPIIKSLNFNN